MDARVHLGAGAPLVRLRWVFTDQPFLPVGTGSVINNRIWNEDAVSDLAVGQLPLAEADYAQDARWRLPAGFASNHQCQPEWFATGEPWPSALPPTQVDDYWIPFCCGSAAFKFAGGLEIGGQWGAVATFTAGVSGGLEIGGQFGAAVEFVEALVGGLEIGGQFGAAVEFVEALAGGLEIGGQIPGNSGYESALAGGLEVGGEWGAAVAFVEGFAGGLEVGGQFGAAVEFVEALAGGVEIGGQWGAAVAFVSALAGGLELGGSFGQTVTFVEGFAGGLEIGGSIEGTFSTVTVTSMMVLFPPAEITTSTDGVAHDVSFLTGQIFLICETGAITPGDTITVAIEESPDTVIWSTVSNGSPPFFASGDDVQFEEIHPTMQYVRVTWTLSGTASVVAAYLLAAHC